MSEYGIEFADWCEFPPETMVGETVFDGGGNAIGWIVNATVGVEADDATMRKLHERMNAELIGLERKLGIEHADCSVIVPFVANMHEIIEDAATVGVGTCKDLGGTGANGEDVFNCSECGCVLSLYDGEGVNTLCTSLIHDYPRFCPECGARVTSQ